MICFLHVLYVNRPWALQVWCHCGVIRGRIWETFPRDLQDSIGYKTESHLWKVMKVFYRTNIVWCFLLVRSNWRGSQQGNPCWRWWNCRHGRCQCYRTWVLVCGVFFHVWTMILSLRSVIMRGWIADYFCLFLWCIWFRLWGKDVTTFSEIQERILTTDDPQWVNLECCKKMIVVSFFPQFLLFGFLPTRVLPFSLCFRKISSCHG